MDSATRAAPGAEPVAPVPSVAAPAAAAQGIVRVKVPPGVVEPFLAQTQLFGGARALLPRLSAEFFGLECEPGATLVAAGVENDGLGVLFDGTAALLLPEQQGSAPLVETIQSGDYFGEVALLLGGPSPYTVIANDLCRVLWLPGAFARNLFGNIPAISDALSRRMARRFSRLCHLERTVLALQEVTQEPEISFRPTLPRTGDEADRVENRPIPFVELADFDVQPSVLNLVPGKLIRQHRVIPVRLQGRVLTVAMVAPRNQAALAELRRTLTTMELEVVAISGDDFNHGLTRLKIDPGNVARGANVKGGGGGLNPDQLTFDSAATEAERESANPTRAVGDDVVKFVNKIIVAGLEREASDIHIEPTSSGPRVRYRVNGLLSDWTEPVPAAATHKSISARFKVLAGLDITERRLPQDGRIGLKAGTREVDLRVSTLPANRGEKIVLRVLEAAGSTRHLDAIFLDPYALQMVRRSLARPFGGILVGGPTGSGKTSTLYSALNERKAHRPDTNIMTVEDPIEYRLPGVTQTQVNTAAGLGFSQVLRAMLRQDPDVIVVGETRDHDTAVIALEAAMTGHLVLTSLHANTALSAIQRLENLGCGRALISQSVSLACVQRLVRKLCSACRQLEKPPKALLDALVARGVLHAPPPAGLPRAIGCDACNHTGYVGRAVVAEVLQVTDDIRSALANGRTLTEVRDLAVQEKALMTFPMYSAALLQRQIISASEVLLAVAD